MKYTERNVRDLKGILFDFFWLHQDGDINRSLYFKNMYNNDGEIYSICSNLKNFIEHYKTLYQVSLANLWTIQIRLISLKRFM